MFECMTLKHNIKLKVDFVQLTPPPFNTLSLLMSFQTALCGENVCIGSVMVPTLRKPDEVRGKEDLLSLATDFIDQYYTNIKR